MKYKDAKEEIKNRISIVDVIKEYVPLKQSGSNWLGICPFHPDKNPSMSVSESRKMFKCFACNEAGDVFHFLEKYLNISYFDAVKRLAKVVNIEIDNDYQSTAEYKKNEARKEALYKLHKDVANLYYKYLHSDVGKVAYDYLTKKRKLNDKTILKFGLGYAPKNTTLLYNKLKEMGYDDEVIFDSTLFRLNDENRVVGYFYDRIIFPVVDINQHIIGFQSRTLNKEEEKTRKYLNSKTTLIFHKDNMLYGYNIAFYSKADYYILCEGNMDVITLYQNGYDNAMGAQGTAFNDKQIFLLKRKPKKIYLCEDMDDAGIKAKNHIADMLRKHNFETYMIDLNPVKDVDEFLNDSRLGKSEFVKRISDPIPSILYYAMTSKLGLDLDNPYDFEKYIDLIVTKLVSIDNSIVRENYAKKIALQEKIDSNKLLNLISERLKGNSISKSDLQGIKDETKKITLNEDSEEFKQESNFIYLIYINEEYRDKIRDIVSVDDLHYEVTKILYEKYLSGVKIDSIFSEIENYDQSIVDTAKRILTYNYNYDEFNTNLMKDTLNKIIRNIKINSIKSTQGDNLDNMYETNIKIKELMSKKFL